MRAREDSTFREFQSHRQCDHDCELCEAQSQCRKEGMPVFASVSAQSGPIELALEEQPLLPEMSYGIQEINEILSHQFRTSS